MGERAINAALAGALIAIGACTSGPAPATATPPAPSATHDVAAKSRSCSLPRGHYARYNAALSRIGGSVRNVEALEAAYFDVLEVVSRHYAERKYDELEACCAKVRSDRLAFEYCSAASAFANHERDATKLADAMPQTQARIDASNELDLMLGSDRARKLPSDPVRHYYRRLWELAQAGDLRVIDNFMTMGEKSHGVHAEGAEIALCRVRKVLPAPFASGVLPSKHPRLVAELRQYCAEVLEYQKSLESVQSR